eukprot:3463263-Pleurochrysis_carterae.AAC.1
MERKGSSQESKKRHESSSLTRDGQRVEQRECGGLNAASKPVRTSACTGESAWNTDLQRRSFTLL